MSRGLSRLLTTDRHN